MQVFDREFSVVEMTDAEVLSVDLLKGPQEAKRFGGAVRDDDRAPDRRAAAYSKWHSVPRRTAFVA
jgi:hypothetical protein